jgi:tetratricopeptide (TPR) repeat protein
MMASILLKTEPTPDSAGCFAGLCHRSKRPDPVWHYKIPGSRSVTQWIYSHSLRQGRTWRAVWAAVALAACSLLPAGQGMASAEQKAQFKQLQTECKARDADTSIEGCTKFIAKNPGSKEDLAQAYYTRGKAYKTRGNFNAAIEDFTQAKGLNPGYAAAYVERGWCYYNGKADGPHAMADYNKAIKLKPDFAEAFTYRGNIHNLEGDRAQAKADFDFALKLLNAGLEKTPGLAELLKNRAAIYDDLKDYDRAISDLSEALKADPRDPELYGFRGMAYWQKGAPAKAISDLNAAIRRQPNFALAYAFRGLAYINVGDADHALADADHAIALSPDSYVAYFARGALNTLKKGNSPGGG